MPGATQDASATTTGSTSTITIGSTTTGSSTATGTGGSGGAPVQPCPNRPGWETWDDYAPGCSLCVPASPAALPPPIVWEPCDPKSGLASGCQQMKIDWEYFDSAFAYPVSMDVQSDGQVLLSFTRISEKAGKGYRMLIVAAAEGPVVSAMVDDQDFPSKGCTFGRSDRVTLKQGKHIFFVWPDEMSAEGFDEAAVGGDMNELHPKALWSWPKSPGYDFTASDILWASGSGYDLGVAKWGEPWSIVLTSAQIGLQIGNLRAFHDLVHFEASDGIYAGVMTYTPSAGVQDLITFPGDYSRGVMGFGTDGIDMVWMYGEGKGPTFLEPYPTRSVMVAPFTTDAAAVAPTRLRSFPSAVYPLQFAVGCGYAAVEMESNQILVVRLSDGWAWQLAAPPVDGGALDQFRFGTVYGLTCDELWLRAGVGVAMNVARVKLSDLGPGIPPD